MAMPLRIDFVSDVACPWCVVGLRSLMKALDAVGDKVEAEIRRGALVVLLLRLKKGNCLLLLPPPKI